MGDRAGSTSATRIPRTIIRGGGRNRRRGNASATITPRVLTQVILTPRTLTTDNASAISHVSIRLIFINGIIIDVRPKVLIRVDLEVGSRVVEVPRDLLDGVIGRFLEDLVLLFGVGVGRRNAHQWVQLHSLLVALDARVDVLVPGL